MSRCKACDEVLTDKELVRKNKTTGEYEDMCEACLNAAFDDKMEDGQYGSEGTFEEDDWEDHW